MTNQIINQILRNPAIWRANALPETSGRCLPTGFPPLDAALGNGWPSGAISEILTERYGIGEVMLLLAGLRGMEKRTLLWINPPHLPYAPGLHIAGVNPSDCLIALPDTTRDAFWLTEQGAKSGACGAVFAWLEDVGPPISFALLQRLQAAAAIGDTLLFLFRPITAAVHASPALTN